MIIFQKAEEKPFADAKLNQDYSVPPALWLCTLDNYFSITIASYGDAGYVACIHWKQRDDNLPDLQAWIALQSVFNWEG